MRRNFTALTAFDRVPCKAHFLSLAKIQHVDNQSTGGLKVVLQRSEKLAEL